MLTREEWRSALNEVAEGYDRFRPGYPPGVVEDVAFLARLRPAARILEIGPGTGQLTTAFAERGHEILALEPGANLARITRLNCATYPKVRIEETTFESWGGDSAAFDLVLAAQSFHLVDPADRFALAANALGPGGALAVVWNLRMPGDSPAHHALKKAYAEHAPDLVPDQLHQDTPFEDEFDRSGLFDSVFMRKYTWMHHYTTADYEGLVRSHGSHQALQEPTRSNLFLAVRNGLEQAGGGIDIEYRTRLYVARCMTGR